MIQFLPQSIKYHCEDCNNHEDITELVEVVRKYGLFARQEVHDRLGPDLYQAWKVLVLATNEYRDSRSKCFEHRIIRHANEEVRNAQTHEGTGNPDNV